VHIPAAATVLLEHRLQRRAFGGFTDELRPRDEHAAYAIQDRLHEELVSAGHGDLAGSKIGCTTAVMRAYLSISHPAAGGVFQSTVHHGDAELTHDAYQRVGVECELAVRMGRDLPAEDAPPGREAAAAAIGGVMAAIEIVEDRYTDYAALDAYTLIADDFFAAGCVLGPERRDFDAAGLATTSARMLIDGREVGRGIGTDILGDPLAALAWLARRRQLNGRPLQAGELVLLGSLVQTNWVQSGQAIVVENNPLGTVRARF
jgi:2-oxo-3-hexenedioate decarboxylase/2-keto-4-pentenoate hydratase